MMKEKLEHYLQTEGFFPLTSKLSDVVVLVKFENNLANVLQIIDYAKELYLDRDQYEEVKTSLKNMFLEKGISETHIMSLIFTEDQTKSELLAKDDPFCWQILSENLELLIGEDKQPDFYGLKGLLENFLEKYKEDPDQFAVIEEEDPQEPTAKEKWKAYLKKAPYISISIIVINLILCFCCIANPQLFYGKGCVGLAYVMQGQVYRLVTSMFLHGGLDHFFSNMLLLYFLGNILENKVGRIRFAALYMLTGIIGNIFSCFYEYITGIQYVSFGASGAVFGLIGMLFYMVIQRDERIKISMPAMLFMVLYCIDSSFAGEKINAAAHLGGLLSGMLLMFALYPRRKSHEG